MTEDKRPIIHDHPYINKLVSMAIGALKAAGLMDKAMELHSKVKELKPNQRGEIIELIESYVSI